MRCALGAVALNLLWLAFFVSMAKVNDATKYPQAAKVIDTGSGATWLLLPVSVSAAIIVWALS